MEYWEFIPLQTCLLMLCFWLMSCCSFYFHVVIEQTIFFLLLAMLVMFGERQRFGQWKTLEFMVAPSRMVILFSCPHWTNLFFFATCNVSHVWREANKVAEIWVVKDVRIHVASSLHGDQLISQISYICSLLSLFHQINLSLSPVPSCFWQ
jgi:hypothetical protein